MSIFTVCTAAKIPSLGTKTISSGRSALSGSRSVVSSVRFHIIKREEGWAVKKQGAQRAFKVYPTKKEAQIFTKKFLREGHDIVIHKDDGTIESWKIGK